MFLILSLVNDLSLLPKKVFAIFYALYFSFLSFKSLACFNNISSFDDKSLLILEFSFFNSTINNFNFSTFDSNKTRLSIDFDIKNNTILLKFSVS